MQWIYDTTDDSWKTGTKAHGAGVYLESGSNGNQWAANVIYGSELLFLGPFKSQEEAQAHAEKTFISFIQNQ